MEKNVTEQSDSNTLTPSKNRSKAKALLLQDIKGVDEVIKINKNKLMELQVERCKMST